MSDVANTIAPAKLTLSLRVTGVRPDGYHLIDAVMTTLDLHDRLDIRELPSSESPRNESDDADRAPDGRVTFTGPFAAGLVDDERNLVRRALRYAGRRADVMLEKNIPHGGGLGGGSADAAAVLRWAGVSGAGIDGAGIDGDIAMKLGADVPFCLAGGRARVSGIGEIIEPLPPEPGTVILVIPPFSVSTPAVYRAWDELNGARPGSPATDGPNDLEPAALKVEPRLVNWRDAIGDIAGRSPVLAGSGATWFVRVQPGEDGLDLRDELQRSLSVRFRDDDTRVVVAHHV